MRRKLISPLEALLDPKEEKMRAKQRYIIRKFCSMEYFYNDAVLLPRYYSLLINENMVTWSAARRREYMKSPFYREYPIHDYDVRSVEIAAITAMWLNQKNRRKAFASCVKTLNIFGQSPFSYVNEKRCYEFTYRECEMFSEKYTNQDFINLMERLRAVYFKFSTLEDCVLHFVKKYDIEPLNALLRIFEGVSGFKQCNDYVYRASMFFRWMCLRYKVDIGIWQKIPKDSVQIGMRDTELELISKRSEFYGKVRQGRKDSPSILTAVAKKTFPNCPLICSYIIQYWIVKAKMKLSFEDDGVVDKSPTHTERLFTMGNNIQRSIEE
jgi:hypothetical protein